MLNSKHFQRVLCVSVLIFMLPIPDGFIKAEYHLSFNSQLNVTQILRGEQEEKEVQMRLFPLKRRIPIVAFERNSFY